MDSSALRDASISTPAYAAAPNDLDGLDLKPSEGFFKLIEVTITSAIKSYDPSYAAGVEVFSDDLGARIISPHIDPPEELSPADAETVSRAHELTLQFENGGNIKRSTEAISLIDCLLNSTSTNDPNRHYVLYNLALVLIRRVEIQISKTRCETLPDLHRFLVRALGLIRDAVHASPDNIDMKALYLGQLGRTAALFSTLISAGWEGQERQVVELLELERESAKQREVTGAVAAIYMASTLSTIYDGTGEQKYRQEARKIYRRLISSLRERLPLEAAISNNLMIVFTNPDFITTVFIPFVVQFVGLTMQNVVEVPLSAVIGRRAAATAIKYGRLQWGVEWLEQCMMIVWNQTRIRAIAPADAIRLEATTEVDPEGRMRRLMLAFLGLCVDVDMTHNDGTSDREGIKQPEKIAYVLVEHWMRQLHTAREHPTFSNLFKPRPFSSLVAAARRVPVVMLNLWGKQCDALILRGESETDFEHISLDMSEELAGKLQAKLISGLEERRLRSRGSECEPTTEGEGHRGLERVTLPVLKQVLRILWEKVVKPVFDVLNLMPLEDATADPPRITWCLTGPTSFFPLHAAGLYSSDEPGTKAFEYVASSYTPTLSILADANIAVSTERHEEFAGVLAVSVPDAHGLPSIPNTVQEVEALQKAVRESTAGEKIPWTWLNGPDATKKAVLEGIQQSAWVHLACHARQLPLNTSESAFALAGGESLSLADVGKHAKAGGELAFLSACQTAAGDVDLSEEGVHLAAGMLVAGYRSVIASAWSVGDRDARDVAEAVYRRLLKGGKVDRTGAAIALHHATRELRDRLGKSAQGHEFVRWAPFMHLGI